MYAKLCRKISEGAKNFEYDNPDYVKSGPHDNTFCKYLLAKCQHEFNNRCQASEAFGDGPLSDEDEERRDQTKKMMLGNIKFICELGKQNLADENILHRCIVQLCKKKVNIKHTVEDFECLCQIMRTVGKLLDTERGKSLMDQYFSRMEKYANGSELPLRIKFKIQDVLDLRRNKWVPRTIQFDQNPKTLGQIREEATKDYSFLQPGGSIMGSFSMNQFPGSGGAPLNVRGSSSYGQQQSIFQVSGQRAIDDLYGANLPSFGNNSANSSMNNSFENSSTGGSKQQYGGGGDHHTNNNNPNYQSNPQPRRVIGNQPFSNNNSSNHPRPANNNKMNDMSSSSSNSSLRDDEQMNLRNQQQNYNNNRKDFDQSDNRPSQQNYNQGGYNNNRQQQNYHDSRPMNNRYNNNNYQNPNPNPNYQNRNNSGERMNNKMGNMNLRDQNPNNRNNELPPRFQKMQFQQNRNMPPSQATHSSYGNQQPNQQNVSISK